MYRVTAHYGRLQVSSCIPAEDIQAATISGELAYPTADVLVVEGC